MEFLQLEENKNFYYDGKDSWFNINTNEKVMKEVDVNQFFGNEASIKFYSTGALVTYKIFNFLKIYFVRNDGKRLFNFEPEGLHKSDNRITYVSGYGCKSGVLIGCQYEDGSSYYEYHTYNAVVFTSNDFCELDKRITKFEKKLDAYYKEARNKKQDSANDENNRGKRL